MIQRSDSKLMAVKGCHLFELMIYGTKLHTAWQRSCIFGESQAWTTLLSRVTQLQWYCGYKDVRRKLLSILYCFLLIPVFKYKNDSVARVDKRGYYHCNETSQGLMFKDGNTVFLLDKPGFYYFVSGDFDHCRKGQRLMIEVKGQQLPPSMAGPSPSPSAAVVSWIIPSFRTLVALEAFMIMAGCFL